MNEATNMRREFEAWLNSSHAQNGYEADLWQSWQAATAAKDTEIAELRKNALRAATVAFSLMVINRPNELPDDAQQLAEWLEINALHLLPVDDDAEVLFIDIIREDIRRGGKV